jgi:hypothetical protein
MKGKFSDGLFQITGVSYSLCPKIQDVLQFKICLKFVDVVGSIQVWPLATSIKLSLRSSIHLYDRIKNWRFKRADVSTMSEWSPVKYYFPAGAAPKLVTLPSAVRCRCRGVRVFWLVRWLVWQLLRRQLIWDRGSIALLKVLAQRWRKPPVT